MKHSIPSWVLPRLGLCFTSAAHHVMDELIWSSAGSSSRFTRRSLDWLIVYDADEEPIIPPEPQILPTPIDVPVPEPFDVLLPEPLDMPPPDSIDVPAPQPRPVP